MKPEQRAKCIKSSIRRISSLIDLAQVDIRLKFQTGRKRKRKIVRLKNRNSSRRPLNARRIGSWVVLRKIKKGEYVLSDPKTSQVYEKAKKIAELEKVGKFKPKGPKDQLTAALGNENIEGAPEVSLQ